MGPKIGFSSLTGQLISEMPPSLPDWPSFCSNGKTEVFMGKNNSKSGGGWGGKKLAESKDERRMERSGAAASGYHAPTAEDIDDIRKDHSTASAAGTINADEGVRRDSSESPGPIDSLSGKVEEAEDGEIGESRSA
jgi:hypothetical protein